MSNPSTSGQISYEPESGTPWAEDVTTFGTAMLPTVGSVDTSGLKHNKIQPNRTRAYRNDGTQWILGTQEGTFKTRLYLTGHGSTCAGAVTAGLVETLLGYVFGNVAPTADGTTFTGGTATVPTTTSSGVIAAGEIRRSGVLGDGRGNGQFHAVASVNTTACTLLTAMDVAPNNADVDYATVMMYPSSSPTATAITGLRFLLQTANMMYECHGCVATAIAFSPFKASNTVPYIDITWTVSWWRYSTATFPNTTATETFQPAPIAAGSVFLNALGTATRVTRTARDLTLSYKLGVQMLSGHGGVSPYQCYVGARRLDDDIRVTWVEDADAATTTPVLPGKATATVAQHMLATLSSANGSAVGFYLRNLKVTTVPTQMNDGGINRFKIEAKAEVGTATTSALTLAPFILASS